jgi:hypothetical protein
MLRYLSAVHAIRNVALGRKQPWLTGNICAACICSLTPVCVQDMFVMPSSFFIRDTSQFARDIVHNFSCRSSYDNGAYSEPLMYLRSANQCLTRVDHPPRTLCGDAYIHVLLANSA